jgi:hypothetical protein
VFVADFDVNGARPLAFNLNGAPAAPLALRPLSSARGPNQAMPANSPALRAFTGVYEFRNLDPATRYRVSVSAGLPGALEHSAIDVVTLPSSIPTAAAGGFDVLLASCFYRDEHSAGALAAAIRNLLGSLRAKPSGLRAPDCALFMGDQVYLDLPTLRDFADDSAFLAKKFEDDYRINWHSSLSPLLSLAPSACLPDDHEYWNNAPHASFQNGNTLSVPGRKRWRDAASAAYEAFAKPFNGSGFDSINDPLVITVHPLSFFLADGRSARDENRAFTITPACRAKLRGWVDELNANNRVGVFVTGQSLVQAPVASLEGKVADWEMPNYADYPAIMAELTRAKQRLLLLTGDVHWGRVASITDSVSGAERLQEVIVSPASLVTTVVSDQWQLFKGWFNNNPWPRHGAAATPPTRLLSGTGPSANLRCRTAQNSDSRPAMVKGDQLGLLSFDWTQARLRASITYFPIHANSSLAKAIVVPLFNQAIAS